MAAPQPIDTDRIWARVGLQELRQTLGKVMASMHELNGVLNALPACNTCARRALIERVSTASQQVGRQSAGLAALSASLLSAMQAVERTDTEMRIHHPEACQCAGEPCRCHG